MKRLVVVPVFVLTCAFGGVAHSAVVLDQSQTSVNIGVPLEFSPTSSDLPLGESFTAGMSGTLDSITLYGNGAIQGGSNSLTIEILAGNGTGGAVLGSVTDAVNQAPDDSFSLDVSAASVKVVSGSQYTFLVTGFSGAGDLPTRGVLGDNANPYAGGQIYTGPGYGSPPSWDLAFQTYVSTGVPEPASWAMLIVGFGMLAATGWRNTRASARSAV